MGSLSCNRAMGVQSSSKHSFDKIKNIPNDQYACTECNLIPEILDINYDKYMIKFKCPKDGEKEVEIKSYFQKEIPSLYCMSQCSQCNSEHKKQIDNENDIFNYCQECKESLCQSCSSKHKHKSPFIKVNELNSKCIYHNKEYIKYCKFCKNHFCDEDKPDCEHKLEEIQNPKPNDIQLIKDKQKILEKNIELEHYLIKFLDTILIYYEKHPKNYHNSINISNISKSIINDDKQNKQNNILREKINHLEKTILHSLNVKLGVELKGDEIKINLNNRNVGNIELNLMCQVGFENLKEINLSNNNISDIAPIKNLTTTQLQKVDLSSNKIQNINVLETVLENNKDIESIKLNNNLIKDITILKKKKLSVLKEINLDNNRIIQKEFLEIKNLFRDKLKTTKAGNEFNECVLIYELNPKDNKIKIFGTEFVNNNRNYCKLKFKNNEKENEINEYYKYTKANENETLEIKLIMNKNISNINCFFNECSSLISISNDITYWNISKIKNMSNVFSGCSSLKSLPDISDWETENVVDMSYMFSGCSSLISLPLIDKWNTGNVTDMQYMFYGCSNLKNLPDISKWDFSKVSNIHNMFDGCSSLTYIPDIKLKNS